MGNELQRLKFSFSCLSTAYYLLSSAPPVFKRKQTHLYYSNAEAAHSANCSSILQLLGCLGIQLDLLLLLCGCYTEEVLGEFTNVHLPVRMQKSRVKACSRAISQYYPTCLGPVFTQAQSSSPSPHQGLESAWPVFSPTRVSSQLSSELVSPKDAHLLIQGVLKAKPLEGLEHVSVTEKAGYQGWRET